MVVKGDRTRVKAWLEGWLGGLDLLLKELCPRTWYRSLGDAVSYIFPPSGVSRGGMGDSSSALLQLPLLLLLLLLLLPLLQQNEWMHFWI